MVLLPSTRDGIPSCAHGELDGWAGSGTYMREVLIGRVGGTYELVCAWHF
jgi:hypothetical protein